MLHAVDIVRCADELYDKAVPVQVAPSANLGPLPVTRALPVAVWAFVSLLDVRAYIDIKHLDTLLRNVELVIIYNNTLDIDDLFQ